VPLKVEASKTIYSHLKVGCTIVKLEVPGKQSPEGWTSVLYKIFHSIKIIECW